MPSFTQLYRDFFETLGRPLTEKDALDFRQLLPPETVVPASIAEFFEIAGNAQDFIDIYEHFLHPRQWIREDNIVAIMEENQGVLFWGYRIEDENSVDPPVYMALAEDHDWGPLDISWSQHILLTLCSAAMNNEETLPFQERLNSNEQLEKMLSTKWTPVAQFVEAGWYAFLQPGCILQLNPAFDYDEPSLYISAKSEEDARDAATSLGIRFYSNP